MSDQHKISEYIENISLKKKLCMGFRPDDVYEVICDLTSMYNEVLAESYREVDCLKNQLEQLERITALGASSPPPPVARPEPKEAPPPVKIPEEPPVKREPEPPRENVAARHEGEPKMTDKELQKLKRSELLEILLEQSREAGDLRERISALYEENASMQAKLEDRRIKIEKAGTLAEASLLINGVLESAQSAAQQYLDNLQELYDREEVNCEKKEAETEAYVSKLMEDTKRQCEELEKTTADKCASMTFIMQERCDAMKEETEQLCAKMEEDIRRKCEELERETKLRCEEQEKASAERCAFLDQKAKRDVDKRWEELTGRLEEFYRAHEGLRELLTASGQIAREIQ